MKTIIAIIAVTLIMAAWCLAGTGTGWYGEMGCVKDGVFWNCSSVIRK